MKQNRHDLLNDIFLFKLLKKNFFFFGYFYCDLLLLMYYTLNSKSVNILLCELLSINKRGLFICFCIPSLEAFLCFYMKKKF